MLTAIVSFAGFLSLGLLYSTTKSSLSLSCLMVSSCAHASASSSFAMSSSDCISHIPYHPMGDGLVERMNRSLLSLLHSHVDRNRDWEEHLQLSLFLYQITRHATTGLSLYKILFGTNPPSLQISNMPGVVYPNPSEYSSNLRSKVLELRE